jgi:putative ABC transport system substrate-binding protein
MDRRTFGAALATLALDALAQRKAPRIAILTPNAKLPSQAALMEGLRELGYTDVEIRSADGDFAKLPALAADVVRGKPDVIVSFLTQATLAAKDATTTIPIVMAAVSDPVGAGIVGNLARPGGNVTGTALGYQLMIAKQVEILRQILPKAKRMDVLWNPDNVVFAQQMVGEALIAASRHRLVANPVGARSREQVEQALAFGGGERPDALMVLPDPVFNVMPSRIAELALAARMPTISVGRSFAEAGLLASYGSDIRVMAKRAAVCVQKILRGAKPGELAIEQPTKFELVFNARTAESLGLVIPPALLARADEVLR